MQDVAKAEELLALSLEELRDRYSGPTRDDFRDFVRSDLLAQQRLSAALRYLLLMRLERLLEVGYHAVLVARRLLVVACGQRGVVRKARLVQLGADALHLLERALLLLPLRGCGVGLRLQVGEFLLQLCESLLRGFVLFLL